ncbi:MAG: ATP-dependent zinc metalloprotease FtsH [Thermaerobacter sp.]|jgi:cell division protease FtsH|nr:ATP-dependent zinc metalloprotease FtsH [Thermaerobacter sp.]
MKFFRNILPWLLLAALVFVIADELSGTTVQPTTLSYSTFYSDVAAGQVKTAKVQVPPSSPTATVTGTLKNGTLYQVYILASDQTLLNLMQSKVPQVKVNSLSTPWYEPLLSTVLPLVILVGAFFFLMQQTQGGGNRVMQFGRSRARLAGEERRRVTFEDVAGVDEEKEELQEVVDFLKHPKRYLELGARIPKGVLLFGEPGTGKTLLARAVAGEAGVPFFSISGSDFVEMFVGVGASRVRDLFDQAKKSAPCIVFIDEIDAVGRMRGAGYGGGHDEREQTLNQLLVEMDGFGVNEGIIVMAATNRPDVLDPALLRPGRFDRQVVIHKPDLVGRKGILEVHSRGKPLDKDVDLEVLARRTPGFTGADLANLMNEAALLTARRRKKRIGMPELEEAIERVIAGPEKKSRVISEKEKRVVAYHEAAHALVGKLLPHTDPVHKLSIIPRGMAMGYTLSLPVEDRYLITKDEILDRVTMALGGRAAEDLVFGDITSGAYDDLERATKQIRRLITEYGMSDALGPMTYGTKQEQVFLGRDILRERNYSEEVAAAIDQEVRRLVTECYERAKHLLEQNRDKLNRVAEALLERETLEAEDFEALLASPGEKAS